MCIYLYIYFKTNYFLKTLETQKVHQVFRIYFLRKPFLISKQLFHLNELDLIS